MLNWLLLFVPVTLALESFVPDRYLLIFACAALAILPLAGLFNATFGNATELIIGIAALRAGLHDVVKASFAGSIIGDILLVLGGAMLCGDMRYPEQHFNATGARSQAPLLTVVAIALLLPAAYKASATTKIPQGAHYLSVSISVVLLIIYALSLLYSLITHKREFVSESRDDDTPKQVPWPMGKALLVLGVAT